VNTHADGTPKNHRRIAENSTAFHEKGGKYPKLPAHSSPKTTKLYDRTNDEISLDEVERIII
jgi:hypothetical protein